MSKNEIPDRSNLDGSLWNEFDQTDQGVTLENVSANNTVDTEENLDDTFRSASYICRVSIGGDDEISSPLNTKSPIYSKSMVKTMS